MAAAMMPGLALQLPIAFARAESPDSSGEVLCTLGVVFRIRRKRRERKRAVLGENYNSQKPSGSRPRRSPASAPSPGSPASSSRWSRLAAVGGVSSWAEWGPEASDVVGLNWALCVGLCGAALRRAERRNGESVLRLRCQVLHLQEGGESSHLRAKLGLGLDRT